jgi:hypothetical protein
MSVIDVTKSFGTRTCDLEGFFRNPGLSFYIPLYQREYSWEEDNIDQLIDDISRGVKSIQDQRDDKQVRFLGTIITVVESQLRANIDPKETAALPTRIEKLIDGQQRISTIAILASILLERLNKLSDTIKTDSEFFGLKEAVDDRTRALLEIFSFDLGRGNPQRKPKIIRGSIDRWTLVGSRVENYKSDLASYLAECIEAYQKYQETKNSQTGKFILAFPDKVNSNPSGLIAKNIKKIREKVGFIENAHKDEDGDFPAAWDLVERLPHVDLWMYERKDLQEIISNLKNLDSRSSIQENACRLLQLLVFSHYLLKRCCFTLIEPIDEGWAFDMFQSLNATGQPLTSIETFKPLIVNIEEQESSFKDSETDRIFRHVEEFANSEQKFSEKTKSTNEILTIFACNFNGTKLSTRFSEQRKWLSEHYKPDSEKSVRLNFITQMSHTARYLSFLYSIKDKIHNRPAEFFDLSAEKYNLLTFCLIYLREANHKMSNTILARFYEKVLLKLPNAQEEFLNSTKAICAFFTIYRIYRGTNGLDEVYRKLMREKLCLSKTLFEFNSSELKGFLLENLESNQTDFKDKWIDSAKSNLNFTNLKAMCKFAIFMAFNDSIVDDANPGLFITGRDNVFPLLEGRNWSSIDFKSIEHIAPQSPPEAQSNWDTEIYNDQMFHRIGNLTLLPIDINSSVGNKNWKIKWFYFKCIGSKVQNTTNDIKTKAAREGISLQDSTVQILADSKYTNLVQSIVEVGADGAWNRDLIEKRTQRICDILWQVMWKWLG